MAEARTRIGDDLDARLVEAGALAVDGLVAPVEVRDQLGQRGRVERARRHGTSTSLIWPL
jgi:hypothetical protein